MKTTIVDLPAGTRVKMTRLALEMGLHGPNNRSTGIVLLLKDDDLIRVKRDDVKHYETYHRKFWEKE